MKNMPPAGQVVYGVWFDGTSDPTSMSGNETAASVVDRLGFNPGSYQIWQQMPPELKQADFAPMLNPDGTANIDGMFDEGTNASIFFTVYPASLNVTDKAITDMANQISQIMTSTGRQMFIRLAPEMNGEWFNFGNQPVAFVAFWIRCYNIFNAIVPQAAIVWSPNFNGPNSNTPYAPYWPGEQYVDWVGISLYWKGFNVDWPWQKNNLAPQDYAAQIMDGYGSEGGSVSLYKEFAVKYNKPFVISETGAAWNQALQPVNGTVTPLPPGPGHAALEMSLWNGFLFNQTFLQTYPLFKMVFAFEIYKVEDGVQRDFRATFGPSLDPFVAGLSKMDKLGAIAWAQKTANVVTVASTAAASATAAPTTKSAGVSIAEGVFGIVAVVVALLL
ncbi:hypothetical protein HDU98_003938 [Podochytrium sp. JEL0797]|nr:hypothetical protein HDU98_003938 [Podochytrium sp. JEL0797]